MNVMNSRPVLLRDELLTYLRAQQTYIKRSEEMLSRSSEVGEVSASLIKLHFEISCYKSAVERYIARAEALRCLTLEKELSNS